MQGQHLPVNLQRQKGATLLVGLVILLLMTFIGLAAIRGSGMQELMAGNMRDRQLAFQAAEAALSFAEAKLAVAMAQAGSTLFNGNTNGHGEAMDGSSNTGYWQGFSWSGPNAVATTNMGLKGVASQPVYVVEKLVAGTMNSGGDGGAIDKVGRGQGTPPEYYRVTSRGVGGTASAVVILQSNFKPF